MKHCRDYSSINWSEFVEYSSDSITGLCYISNKQQAGRKHSQKAVDSGRIGWVLSYKGSRWLVHRIIACLELGGIKQCDVVDHLDGNPYNNKINNLRVTDQSTNLKNKCKQSNNTSGINGVGIYTRENGSRLVVATFKSHRKAVSKSFHVIDGDESSALMNGANWLQEMQNADGLFTERHGK